jgi:hypothetical protein
VTNTNWHFSPKLDATGAAFAPCVGSSTVAMIRGFSMVIVCNRAQQTARSIQAGAALTPGVSQQAFNMRRAFGSLASYPLA